MDGNGGAPKPMEAGESKQGGAKEEVKERERCREQSPAGGKCDDGDSSQQPPHVPIVPQQVKTETDAVGKSAETHATTNVNDEHVLSSLPESARVDIDTSTHKPRVGVASDTHPSNPTEDALVNEALSPAKAEEVRIEKERVNVEDGGEMLEEEFRNAQPPKSKIAAEADARHEVRTRSLKPRIPWETRYDDGDESGTEEEQHVFRKEVEAFYRERSLEFKAPKFYKEELNLLKLYRAVIKLGGYEQVTSCKLWRQVGAPFRPPKTCTTVSWTFRNFYEKALLEYEKYRMQCGEVHFIEHPIADSKIENQVGGSHPNQALTSGRALRDAAARAMQGWQSHGFGNPEDGKSSFSPKSDKHMRSSGLLKRKKTSVNENTAHLARTKATKPQLSSIVVDIGPPADWVKINVYKINDCFEVYALVPGLLREESDPAGRLIISGQPQQMDNPWGVTPFKKVVSLPSRIDPLQTSAVVTLNGQLFVRVPFEQKDL